MQHYMSTYLCVAYAGHFCWFLNNEEVRAHIEEYQEYFTISMLNVYRATDLMFPGENEVEEARSFSRKVLEKITLNDSSLASTGLNKMVIKPVEQRIAFTILFSPLFSNQKKRFGFVKLMIIDQIFKNGHSTNLILIFLLLF